MGKFYASQRHIDGKLSMSQPGQHEWNAEFLSLLHDYGRVVLELCALTIMFKSDA
jgi:hypothetical protein